MASSGQVEQLESGRVTKEQLDANFSDLHPEFDSHEAAVAADRCYFCYDAHASLRVLHQLISLCL